MRTFAWLGATAFGALMVFGATDPASAQNCTNQDTLRSPPGATPATNITFVNRGPESRRIFWVDGNGQRKFYKEIGPGDSLSQPTFVGHPWIAAREDDRCQTVVMGLSSPRTVDVTRSCVAGQLAANGTCTQ